MQIALLGPLEVRDDSGRPLELRGARLRALLILLALQPSRVMTTGALIDRLWGEQVPAEAGNALQALVSRLRRAVPGLEIVSRPAGYELRLAPELTDIRRFEELAAAGHADVTGDPARAAATLRAALDLWRGPPLADVAEAGFAQPAIARLEELRLTAIGDRIDADLRLGVTAAPLVAELEGLVAAHPMREPLIGLLMRALAAAGRRAAALGAYEQARSQLAEQLGADPSPELAALHLAMLRSGPEPPAAGNGQAAAPPPSQAQAEPAPAEPAPPSTNLPAGLTSFIGRDSELETVVALLREHRLVTLTGPGGAGKTRLAVETARAETAQAGPAQAGPAQAGPAQAGPAQAGPAQAGPAQAGTARAGQDAPPSGVWLTEFAPVTDPAEVTSTVLATLGLRDRTLARVARTAPAAEAPVDLLGRLVAALSGQHVLLVLDNCEHVIDAVAALAYRVLSNCPRVRILATSREPLNVTGEVLCPVQPLALPPPGAGLDPDAITGFASVQLLVQRASAVRPDFAVTPGNAVAVARICRSLDGIPLAIELAAARLSAMSPDQVAARLDDKFQLLTGGSRAALPRHQTLRAVVDWSWDLLDDAERALWRRFSVFAGGATLEAAERVCAGGPVQAGRVLDLLAALADKSLLAVRHGQDGPRYRMLEIIRAYGQERLAAVGEQAAVQVAHAAYFREHAQLARRYLLGADQLVWLRRLTDDHDNLNAAIHASVAAGDAPAALGLVGNAGWYWWLRGHKAEGTELIREALAIDGEAPDELWAAAYTLGALLALDGSYDDGLARAWFQASADIIARMPQVDEPALRLVAPLKVVFDLSVAAGGGPGLAALLDPVVDDPDPWVRATGRMIRGHVTLNFGGPQAPAEADFLAASGIYQALGERWGMAFTLVSLATLARWRGEHAVSVDLREQAQVLAAELGALEDEVQFRADFARELWLAGQRERARAELARALRDAEQVGLPESRASVSWVAGDLARLDGELAVARRYLAQAAELAGRQTVPSQLHALIATSLGYIAGAEGDLDTARSQHARALETARSSFDAPVIAAAVAGVADLALREGDPARAAGLLGASLAIRGTPDQSAVDEARVARAARAALGDAAYDDAFRRGLSVTMGTVGELTGLPTSGA